MTGHTTPSLSRDHPRACGEHSEEIDDLVKSLGSSPRMRGTRHSSSCYLGFQRIIPAHAGNTHTRPIRGRYHEDHPRACGEHEALHLPDEFKAGSSPRMRGTLRTIEVAKSLGGIIPAHAGNTDHDSTPLALSGDHPRACGEHLYSAFGCTCRWGSSPRMRGTPRWCSVECGAGGDYPRACGEHRAGAAVEIARGGSSPRMRGTHTRRQVEDTADGIIPAHAGNTVAVPVELPACGDHPRACGEHYLTLSLARAALGSSPRMRGTPDGINFLSVSLGIIPAHAGNTWLQVVCGGHFEDHPRACGEHGLYSELLKRHVGSSPRMRGTPCKLADILARLGIIPAHAGNTLPARIQRQRQQDHPRACGEHHNPW